MGETGKVHGNLTFDRCLDDANCFSKVFDR